MLDLHAIREQFPGLQRRVGDHQAIFFDGPAGSQVPIVVANAVRDTLLHCNANEGGYFATSIEVDELLERGIEAVAAFYGVQGRNIAFGANMTTLTFHFTRAIAQTLQPGDEIIVTRLDHDANVSPWALAAQTAGATVRYIPLKNEDCTLDLEAFEALLSPQTRWVAVGLASNATGGINPIRKIADMAHKVGARVFVDAVHYAPHGKIDVPSLGCDALAASSYKFFGPHMAMLWAQEDLFRDLPAFKVRPATEDLPFRWMTGTPNFEGIAGTIAAIEYIASLGSEADGLRGQLSLAFDRIRKHEYDLMIQLIRGLQRIDDVRIWGITDEANFDARVPTLSITHSRLTTTEMAKALAEKGIFVWSGNHYALQFSEFCDLEPGGTLRIGLLHYNTEAEVARLLTELASL